MKRVASAVGEGSVVVSDIHEYLAALNAGRPGLPAGARGRPMELRSRRGPPNGFSVREQRKTSNDQFGSYWREHLEDEREAIGE